MPYQFSSPRLLMNRLRDLMAQSGDSQERLDRIVQLIAGTMVADVCSIYLRTDADVLELVATEGLEAGAVHITRLRIDEGLVGQIALTAEPLSIQDAPRHPAFSYRPETGEDPYHAFLGVPILRGGAVIGVLTVQNRTERLYEDDEVETLQTIAMVLAEVVATEGSENGVVAAGAPHRNTRAVSLTGRALCQGLAIGKAHLHDPVVSPAKFFATDPTHEQRRLEEGLEKLRASVDKIIAADGLMLGTDPRDILETFRMLANDRGWASRLTDGVRAGLSAEAAVDRARREHRARLENAKDPYLRERLFDLEDLDNRLLRILGGGDADQDVSKAQGAILVARRLGPAELLEYANAGLAAIVLEEAADASHAAIVARALNIPTLGGVAHATVNVESGDTIIVDADDASVHIRPDESLETAYNDRIAIRSEQQAIYHQLRDQPAVTTDGTEIQLLLNAGLNLDIDHVSEAGADGIGLFRTEFQFLVSERLPSVGEQTALYARVLDAARGRPVLFRTIDLGADKLLLGQRVREDNPALGWRSVRLALDRKGLFRRQLRALLRAAAGRPLSVMFPMVTTADEFLTARQLLDQELSWSVSRGHPAPLNLSVGVMLEVPALAYQLDALAGHADFVSIGTNDLMQFFFAADRMSPAIADRYDILSTPALRFLKHIRNRSKELGMPISVCGDAAGRPLEALALMALGYRRLSMPGGDIGRIKRLVRSVHLERVSERLHALLDMPGVSLRNELLAIAHDTGATYVSG